MRRNLKHGMRTNGTIRYVGNNKYSNRGIFEKKTRFDNIVSFKTKHIQHCLLCQGSKFSCKGIPHEVNQYGSKKGWTNNKDKRHNKFAFISDYWTIT